MTRTVTVGPRGARQAGVRGGRRSGAGGGICGVHGVGVSRSGGSAARDVLEHSGMGEAFTHGTGHGLGLEIHERPAIDAVRARGCPSARWQPGMVLTLEPGVYFPGWGGVRIEDDVLVDRDGRGMADRVR